MRLIQYKPGTKMPGEHDWISYCNHPDTDPRTRGLGMAYQITQIENILLQKAIEAVMDEIQLDIKVPALDGLTTRQLIAKIRRS